MAEVLLGRVGVSLDGWPVGVSGSRVRPRNIPARAGSTLVKRAERRQASFGLGWREVAQLALMVASGYDRDSFRTVGVSWRDASTPSFADSTSADRSTGYRISG